MGEIHTERGRWGPGVRGGRERERLSERYGEQMT